MTPDDSPPSQMGINSDWLQRESVLDRFEVQWRTNGPQSIDSFIREASIDPDDAMLVELIKLDMEYRWNRGDRVSSGWYLERYPSLARSNTMRAELADAENRLNATIPQTALDHASNYLIGAELGRGGFATVYRARDLRLQRDVAIKRLHPQYCNNPELRERLVREARAAASLRHPAIVPVYEVDEQNPQPSIVMALIDGVSLAEWIRNKSPTPDQSARWVRCIADALQYAHDNGVIHRDVKSSNILIQRPEPDNPAEFDSFGSPLLSDFGLALHLDGGVKLTQSGEAMGTPAYASPELIRGQSHRCDHRTDVYSLGIVLYELLCDRLPFAGTTVQVLRQVLDSEPIHPRHIRPNIPRDMETICLKAMAKLPWKRYQSAGEMANDLRAWLEKRPIRARRASPMEKFLLMCQRYPAQTATICVAIIALVFVSSYSLVRVLEERDRYLVERNRAQESLYSAIVSEARSQMRARETGWWWHAMDSIRQASSLNVNNRNPRELRELAIECMGTEYPCFRMLRKFHLGSDVPTCIALSFDGISLGFGTSKNQVHVIHAESGEPIATLTSHESSIVDLAFRPGGSILASADRNGKICFWDLNGSENHVLLRSMALAGKLITKIAFSPDGQRLAIGCSDGAVHVVSLPEIQALSDETIDLSTVEIAAHVGSVTCLSFSFDGAKLASGGSDEVIRVWISSTGQSSLRWTRPNVPSSVAFANLDHALVVADSEAFGFSIKQLSTGESRPYYQIHGSLITQLHVLTTGSVLTSSLDGTMRVWQPNNYREIALASDELPGVRSFEMSSDETKVYAIYNDGIVRVWELYQPVHRYLVGSTTQNAVFVGASNKLVDGMKVMNFGEHSIESEKIYIPAGSNPIAAVPGSQHVFRGDSSGNVSVWDLTQQKELDRWNIGDSEITSLAADGSQGRLAVALADGSLTLWNYPSKQQSNRIQSKIGRVKHLGWASSGDALVASGPLGTISWTVGEPAPRKLPQTVLPDSPICMANGLVAFCLNDSGVAIASAKTFEVERTIAKNNIDKVAVSFSNDERWLAIAAVDRTIEIWNTESWKLHSRMICEELMGAPKWIAWESTGKNIASGGNNHSAIWNIDSKLLTAWTTLRSEHGVFAADGQAIVLSNEKGALLEWSIQDIEAARNKPAGINRDGESLAVRADVAKIVVPGGHVDQVWGMAASPNGRWFATASHDTTVKLWDASNQLLVRTFEGQDELAWCAAFSMDSKWIASGGNSVLVWDAETSERLFEFRDHSKLITSVVFHPNGKWFGSCGADGRIALREFPYGQLLCILDTGSMPLHSLDFSPDGKSMVAACSDHTIKMWQVEELPFSKSNRETTTLGSDSIQTIEPHAVLRGHKSSVRVVRFSPDGAELASGAEAGSLIIWDVNSFEKLVEMKGGTGQIRGLSFSQDGRFVAGAAYISKTIVWDLNAVHRSLRAINLDW